MEDVSLEHRQIAKLWDQIVFFPKLYSQTRDWLSNSRHKKIYIFPFSQILEILVLASNNVDNIKKNIELVKLCSFNLEKEFVKDRLDLFDSYRSTISVDDYVELEKFIDFSKESKRLIDTHMTDTYVLKNRTSLNKLLNLENFTNSINIHIEEILFALLEIKYNFIQQNSEPSLIELIDSAIEYAKNVEEVYNDCPIPNSKHLSLEKELRSRLLKIKYILQSG